MTTGKTIALTKQNFVSKVMSLLFNMLSRLVIAFLPRSNHLLISWLQSPSAVILESKKIKSVTVSIVSPSICHEVMWPHDMILVFWMLSFKPGFSLCSFIFIKRLFSFSLLSAIRVVSSAHLRRSIWLLTTLIPACDSSWTWDLPVSPALAGGFLTPEPPRKSLYFFSQGTPRHLFTLICKSTSLNFKIVLEQGCRAQGF